MSAAASLVTYVTDLTQVSRDAILARLSELEVLPPELRSRFAIQLRDPQLDGMELLRFGDLLRTATAAMGAKLIVNDRVDLALALDADGVHLGRTSIEVGDARALLGDGAWVSVSAHGEDGVLAGARRGASAVVLSPIFESPGKGAPLGVEALTAANARLRAEGLDVPIVALGGVTEENFARCLRAGAAGVAAVRNGIPVGELVRELRG